MDPFSLKHFRHWDPRRLIPTLGFRYHELKARLFFERYALRTISPLSGASHAEEAQHPTDTSVTPEQYSVLRESLRLTEHLTNPCVEIGSYRGVTTRFLARATARRVVAVDPFMGWGGCEEDMRVFELNTKDLSNVTHLRLTSGKAAERIPTASFVFIDAVHDYANVRFDLANYMAKVPSGGVVALHDTDNRAFAGVRLAIQEHLGSHRDVVVLFHVVDLVVLQRRCDGFSSA
ncbi:MAG TPA: class I SAM-dependent methyltransferase [Verrucomicrobiae bacterium]